jgi:hypothetical protein
VHSDVKTAKMTSIMSETFYCVSTTTTTTTPTTQRDQSDPQSVKTEQGNEETQQVQAKRNGTLTPTNTNTNTVVSSSGTNSKCATDVSTVPISHNDDVIHAQSVVHARKEQEGVGQKEPLTNKVYVQDRIKTHAIWQSPYFWAEAIFFSVREEVQRNMPRVALPLARILADTRRWMLEHESPPSRQDSKGSNKIHHGANNNNPSPVHRLSAADREHLHTYQQIWFCQIGSYSFNMQSFDLPAATVRAFVKRMCAANCLSDQSTASLLGGIA